MLTTGIIGGSGFIGSYVTKIFLEENFKVKVSSNYINSKSNYEHLLTLMNAHNLEIFPIDVNHINSIEDFGKGCDILILSGTPFIPEVKDRQTKIIELTVESTRNFLQAISKLQDLKKVVFIGCIAVWNTSFPFNPETYPSNHIFTELDIPYINEHDHPNAKAKFLAGQEILKFINEHPDLPFEITSISPTWVVGNSLSNVNISSVRMQYLIKNKLSPNPFLKMLCANDAVVSMIDVRDVAEAVFQSATTKGIHGKNYIIANESYKVSDISLMLNKQTPLAEPAIIYDSALAKKDLGVAFISAEETLKHCI